jgi:hypothetical protein
MRPLLVAAVLMTLAAPALAADAPATPPPAQKRAVAMHYPTLEKMLRRFSRQAGDARTRG